MTAPAQNQAESDLVELLGQVDVSRSRAAAAEQQLLADVAVLYAERAQESEDNADPALNAALLAAVVVLIRKALASGIAEGARFAQAQFDVVGVPVALIEEIAFSDTELGDRLVQDFLNGQIAVAKDSSKDKAAMFAELQRRAEIAVVSAVQAGRGLATEESLKAVAELLGSAVHKLWVARFDLNTPPCPMCTRLHGQHVPVTEAFVVPGSEPKPYFSPLNSPPRHPNCRCSLVLYLPEQAPKSGVTPLTMQAYATWALSASEDDRADYIAATIVHVKPYTRMVDGKLQQVSGYYYDTKTGMKIPDMGQGAPAQVKQVSAKQAKAIAKLDKAANKATPKGGDPSLEWKPGTYKIDNPSTNEDTQVIVHQDGSSTSIHKGVTEDTDKAKTAQFLSLHKQAGTVQKISDDPDVPDPDGPGPLLHPDAEAKKNGTLPEGFYMLGSKDWGGIHVKPDGSAEIYKPDFQKKFPLGPVAVKQIANGSLGEFDEVEQRDFNSAWHTSFKESKAGGAKAPKADAPGSPSAPNASASDEPGDKQLPADPDAPDFKSIPDVNIPDEPPMPEPDKAASGLVVLEPDGSLWIYEPKDHYAGYEHTFPKGSHEPDLTLQQNAHKELFEEVGITAEITGYLGDYRRSRKEGGKVRMYVATRKGGDPLPDDPTPYSEGGNETASVKNVSPEEAAKLLNVKRDQRILKDLVEFGVDGRAPADKKSASDAAPQPSPSAPQPSQTVPNRPGASQTVPNRPEPSQTVPNRPGASQTVPDAPAAAAIPDAPKDAGHGEVVKDGPSLFSVGAHSVQVEEGSQVYKSGKSKDTLYVLKPDGDLIKYNPQGAGVQATKVGSSENAGARAKLIAPLNNVTDDGVSIANQMPTPGTGKALVGGFEMTVGQLDTAIAKLSANPSGNVVSDLKAAGNPLASGKFHAVAAPYKAYYNNKTKPALIAALKNAKAQTGSTPLSEAPAVAHLEEKHGLSEHHASLGHADHEAIHSALHAVDPKGSDHTHQPASPGFITFDGIPMSPQAVAEGLDALKKSPKNETGIKKPLKAINSPLSGANLQELANTSSITDSYKGGNGKVHYGKLKPAVIALLQDALDKHQTQNPPTPRPAAVIPEPQKSIQGVSATQAQIKEMQDFFASIDLDAHEDPYEALQSVAHNPLANGVDWDALADGKFGAAVPLNQANEVLHNALNDYLDVKTPLGQSAPVVPKSEDTSPRVSLSGTDTTVDQLKTYKSALDNVGLDGPAKLPSDNALQGVGAAELAPKLGVEAQPEALKQAVSDAIQQKIDDTIFENNHPPLPAPGAAFDAPSTISIGGKNVTKQELLDAITAVKNSPSTGVKGPLKEIDSPLSKVDIKAWVEADPLSAPYKGGNGKVHYGKLKDAVASVLQAKADEMGSPAQEVHGPDTVPDVTPAGEASPNVPDAPGSSEDDFFNEPPVTDVASSDSEQLKKIIQNAINGMDISGQSDSPAVAFQLALKEESAHYYSLEDDWVTPYYNDVADSPHYEFTPDGAVFKVNGGSKKQLSDADVVDLLAGQFDQSPGLGSDLAGTELPSQGFYSSPGGMALKVFPDGTAQMVNTSSGQQHVMSDPESVKTLLEMGTWDKISDTPNDPNAVIVNGVEAGAYTAGMGHLYHVYSDGSVLVDNPTGTAMMNVDLAKPYVQSMGAAPGPTLFDPPEWALKGSKDPNGFLQGTYHFADGDSLHVFPDGPHDVSPQTLAKYIFDGTVSYDTNSAIIPSTPDTVDSVELDDGPDLSLDEFDDQVGVRAPAESKLSKLVAKAKAAPPQDPWAQTTTAVSKGFQAAVKTGEVHYATGLSGNTILSTGAKPQVAHYKFSPDGTVQSFHSSGALIKTWAEDDLVSILDHVYDGPSVQDPAPAAPETDSPELHPDGTWQGHPLGTWTNGEGVYLEVTSDGPELAEDDIDGGLDAYTVMEMMDSGELTWVPPVDTPAPSTPSSMVDPDAPVLQPFMTAGYIQMGWSDKPQLLAAVESFAKDAGLEGVVGQHLSTHTKNNVMAWLNHFAKGEWDKAYEIEAQKVKNHKKKLVHPGSPDNPANASGFTKKKMPPLIPGEIPAGAKVPGSFPQLESWYAWDEETTNAYMVAANMQNPTGLSNNQKKKWVSVHSAGDKIATDSLSLLGQKNVNEGQIYSSPILPPVEKYAPGQAVPLPDGFPEIDFSKASVQDWTNNQLDQYLNHVGPSKKAVDFLAGQSPETKAAVVALHAVAAAPPGSTTFKDPALAKKQMDDLIGKIQSELVYDPQSVTAFIHDVTKLNKKTYTMNKEQPPLGGGSASEIFQLTDELGSPFLFKVAPEKFRAEVEHAGHVLAQLSGIKVAASELGTFNGKFGQFQAKVDSKGTLKHVPVSDLPLSALKDLMAAHVQDWATANDDAHGDNFLLMPDGKRVMAIDIARSFVRFGQPGSMSLKVGQLSNWTNPYYDNVYKAALNKKLSDADVDSLYKASITQAKRTAGVDDAAWASAISKGLKNRTNFGWTSAKNLPELVKQATDRKNALPEDFEKFWDDIYSSLGREKPNLAKSQLAAHVFSGFTEAHLDRVKEAGHGGASTFFAGTALEENHFLAQEMVAPGGKKELHMTAILRKEADAVLRKWLNDHVTENLSVGETGETQKELEFLSSVGAENYAQHVLSAAKTVSHHNKQGDQNFNSTHMANFEAMKTDVAKKLDEVAAGVYPSSIKDWPDAQVEYKNVLDFYDSKLKAVTGLIDFGGQSKMGDFDPYKVNVPSQPAIRPEVVNTSGIKVKKVTSYFDAGSVDDDGNFVLSGEKPAGWKTNIRQSGSTFVATLPDGTEIEYRSWNAAEGVARSQQGGLKVKVRGYDGTTAGSEAAMTALQKMGLDLTPAEDTDMELFYWRHLYGVLQDRRDRNSGKYKEVVDEVKAQLPGGVNGTPALEAKEELERWRKAWSRLTSEEQVKEFVDNQKYLPKFSHPNVARPEVRGGAPYWERFDADFEKLKNKPFAVHAIGTGDMGTILRTGGLWSIEDRPKMMGAFHEGQSSPDDIKNGAANFNFVRTNQTGYNFDAAQIYINPRVLAKTTNYSFSGDGWGKIDNRKISSDFDLDAATSITGHNETMIKHGSSVLDDIELAVFKTQAERQKYIDYLKSRGVTNIRGVAIEDRFVVDAGKADSLAKIKEAAKNWNPDEED